MTKTTILGGRTRARGFWTFDAHRPIDVTDPEKARFLLGLPARPRTSRGIVTLERAILPVSIVRRFLELADERARKEFEALLFGGGRLWHEAFENLVVNQGLDDYLDVTLSGATQDTTHFVGLTGTTPTPAAGDTLASHAGWTEVTAYSETNRVAFVDAGASSQSLSNAASPATFTINADSTVVGGGFLAGINTGTAGRMTAVGAFTAGDKSLDNLDTLDVTATFTQAAA